MANIDRNNVSFETGELFLGILGDTCEDYNMQEFLTFLSIFCFYLINCFNIVYLFARSMGVNMLFQSWLSLNLNLFPLCRSWLNPFLYAISRLLVKLQVCPLLSKLQLVFWTITVYNNRLIFHFLGKPTDPAIVSTD